STTCEAALKDLPPIGTGAAADVSRIPARRGETDESLKRIQTEMPAKPAASAVPPPPVERPAREPARPAQPESAYGTALATFRAREHGQAVLELLDFIGKYPQHPLAPHAHDCIGAAYYTL